jgi:hypothetical protein
VGVIKDETWKYKGSEFRRLYVARSILSNDGITIMPGMHDFVGFVGQMNKYIQANRIQVECIRYGKTTRRDELSISDMYDFKISSIKE